MGTVTVGREPSHTQLAVRAQTDVAAVAPGGRRDASALCRTPTARPAPNWSRTELATNLLRHAEPGGWMLVRPLRPRSVELIAVDRGPGIVDVPAAWRGASRSRVGWAAGWARCAGRRPASTSGRGGGRRVRAPPGAPGTGDPGAGAGHRRARGGRPGRRAAAGHRVRRRRAVGRRVGGDRRAVRRRLGGDRGGRRDLGGGRRRSGPRREGVGGRRRRSCPVRADPPTSTRSRAGPTSGCGRPAARR
jgi:hypothetical protein